MNIYYDPTDGVLLAPDGNGGYTRVVQTNAQLDPSRLSLSEDGYLTLLDFEGNPHTMCNEEGVPISLLGPAGAPGITPQLKIENGYWKVSYGENWDVLGEAKGKDGITPLLKIDDDYWYVSYDEGTTWEKEGKATGEDGKDGVTPKLRIVDGYWEVSYDNEVTWEQLGRATGEDGKDMTLVTAFPDDAQEGDTLLWTGPSIVTDLVPCGYTKTGTVYVYCNSDGLPDTIKATQIAITYGVNYSDLSENLSALSMAHKKAILDLFRRKPRKYFENNMLKIDLSEGIPPIHNHPLKPIIFLYTSGSTLDPSDRLTEE
jgi:hypothetical protein